MPALKTKILVVDDDSSTRLLMSQIFTQLGHRVRSAEDGFAALLEIREECPDLLLSDLNMPGMSGFELLSVVRRRFPAIRVIAMSGAFSGNSVQPGVAADAFYEKATTMHTLLRTVNEITSPDFVNILGSRTISPIWIQRYGDGPGEDASVTVSCPECLRTFAQTLKRASGVVHIYSTDCIHCGSPIYYAIVQAINGADPQAFQFKQRIEIPHSVSHVHEAPGVGFSADGG
jgi:CheY-like chemotaxis protein